MIFTPSIFLLCLVPKSHSVAPSLPCSTARVSSVLSYPVLPCLFLFVELQFSALFSWSLCHACICLFRPPFLSVVAWGNVVEFSGGDVCVCVCVLVGPPHV